LRVEQVQEFTPTPGSLSTCIYHTGRDPLSGEIVHVPRSANEKRLQKALLLYHLPEQRKDVIEALRQCGREDALAILYPEQTAKSSGTKQPLSPKRRGRHSQRSKHKGKR
jgi:hypothetical protein